MKGSISRIGIICGYSFPFGLAPSTRILTYARGIVEQNIKTDIFVYFPTDSEASYLPISGEIFGVNYYYPNTRVYPQSIIFRKLSHLYYAFITAKKIISEHRKKRFDLIIISSDWFRILYFFICLLKIFKIKIIFIADEYPVPIRKYLKDDISKSRKFFFRMILQYVDAMVFMTKNLSIFYNQIIKKPSFILPCITDVTRFSIESKKASDKKYICYMGNMELSKDNVTNIIQAFGKISDSYKWLNFNLYGSPSASDKEKIRDLILKLGLQERVFLCGRIDNELVPDVLSQSYILVSSQPQSKRAMGGFPTKLGEYMATGVPTLLTNVGEIGNYVKDGETAWLVEPENPDLYAKKLMFIIENYNVALDVSENAYKFVLNNFHYETLSKKPLISLSH